jgi:hypothetical protein
VVHAVLDDVGAIAVIGIQFIRARQWSNGLGMDIRCAWPCVELLHGGYVCARDSGKPACRACWLKATVGVWPTHFATHVVIEILQNLRFVPHAALCSIIRASAQ